MKPALLVAILAGLAPAAPAGAATAGNGNYLVSVLEAAGGAGIGTYTAMTGGAHPVTLAYGPQNVLFGGGIPSTSWTTVHSYASMTSYAQRRGQAFVAGAAAPRILEDFVVAGEEAVPVGAGGFRTHYRIVAGAGGAGDDLDVFQTVRAVGAAFNDSAVEVTTEVFNLGAQDAEIGIRYLLDVQIGGGDDGPSFQLRGPDGPVQVLEQSLPGPAANTYEILDNNDPSDPLCSLGPTNSPFPLFAVGGSVRGPARLQPTAPTLLQYVSWQHISGLPGKSFHFPAPDPFDYNVGPFDAATCTISYEDSAVAYYWGETPGNALRIPPGRSARVSAYLFAYLPGQAPAFPPAVEDCANGTDDDGDGLVDAMDPDCRPLVVDLASFTAEPGRRGIRLEWTTATESDTAGFALLRARDPLGPYVPVTPGLLLSKGSPVSGASYAFDDRAARRRQVYYYRLVDVDLSGVETAHGPIAASLGAPKPERRRR